MRYVTRKEANSLLNNGEADSCLVVDGIIKNIDCGGEIVAILD